jgi:hypothetical protein
MPLWVGMGLAVSAMTAKAQFQPPTEEELKMTSEPKAPGASAIYLYREETVDDNLHYHGFVARIKVLTEKGKELATVGVPYPKGRFQITDIKARTIHADGTVIPLDVKPTDLLMALNGRGSGMQVNKMVFTLPSVEVGSILEYRWQQRYDDEQLSSPDWDIQQSLYVRKAHYAFTPYKYLDRVVDGKGNSSHRLLYTTMLQPGAKVVEDATGKFVLDISDVAAIPHEDYMPPLEAVIEKVIFYYTPYADKDEFWKHEGGSWSKEMDRFASQGKTLQDAVNKIVGPGDSEEVKARKLYDAVMALDNTNLTRRRTKAELKEEGIRQIKNAEDVWTQKSGSSDEIALLYLAMVRIAHLKAYAMTVCNRDREIFNPFFLNLGQFDDVLVLVTFGGKEIPLDPGEKDAPFGQLGWRHTFTEGMRQSDKGVTFGRTPNNSYKEAATLSVADVTIGKDGSVTGTVRISMDGPSALRWRQRALESDEDEVKKQFNEYLHRLMPDGVSAEFSHFLGLEDYHATLMAMAKITGNIGTVTGKRVFLPGVFFVSRERHLFTGEETRVLPVDMEFAESEKEVVTYRLPEGFTVESVPPDAVVPWKGHAALEVKSQMDASDKSKVEVNRSLARAFTVLEAKEYPQLREFYQKVAAADEQQIVLERAMVKKESE